MKNISTKQTSNMKNTVQDGVCQSCGRDYRSGDELEILFGECDADDCPSKWEEMGIPHPEFSI